MGNESGGTENLEVCLFPWQQEILPDDKDIARIFTFNRQMMTPDASLAETEDNYLELTVEEYKHEKQYKLDGEKICCFDDGTKDSRCYDFIQWLRKIFVPTLYVYCGLDRMNPVPYFILTRLAPGWVGGFLTWVTCT